jgi:predicted PurR-regulated permease PerM
LKEYVPAEYQGDFERAASWLTPQEAARHNELLIDRHEIAPAELEAPTNDDIASSNESRLREIVREEILLARAEPSTPAGVGVGGWWDMGLAGGKRVMNFLGAIIQLGLLAFLIPFYFFFFSVSYPAVVRFGRELIPVRNRQHTLDLIARMDRAVAGFVRGRIIICLIMGVMLAIGWWIVGVPYAIVLGLVIGAFCIVPYLGGIGVPLAIGLLAFDQLQLPESERMTWWAILLWPSVVFGIVQVVENYFLTPMIAGKATNLDPVTILVAVLAGGTVGGMYGMILAIPVAACLKIIWLDVLLPKIRAWSRGEANDPLPV